MLHTRLDNIGATPKHHEAILRSHIFLIAGIGHFLARGVDPGACHQLLGVEGSSFASTRPTTTLRTLRRRSQANSLRQQGCLSGPSLHRGRYRNGGLSRKAARLCGRTASQLKAIVVDRFFETKREAMAWTNAHPTLYDASNRPARI